MSEERRRNLMGAASGDDVPNFGGYVWAPGPLVYENGQFRIQNTWNEMNSAGKNGSSFGGIYGLNEGSTYFSFTNIGQRFDSRGSSFNARTSGDIDNANPLLFDEYEWILPTADAFKSLIGTGSGNISRSGSTVNGNSGKHYSVITTTITYAGVSNIGGYLFFPDKRTIEGKTLNGFDNATVTTGVTSIQLNRYIEQGCIFLPFCGCFVHISSNQWNNINKTAQMPSATSYASGGDYYTLNMSSSRCGVSSRSQNAFWTQVILCRKID